MEELSIFVDESGDVGETSTYYLITIVLHDQSEDIGQILAPYEADLRARQIDDIPMHLGPLLNGNDDYKGLGVSTRKALLNGFRVMAGKLPFQYVTFAYRKSEFADYESLLSSMKRDLILSIFDNIDFFQKFRKIKVYYDNGQSVVTNALHDAVEYALAREAVIYRDAKPADYRLFQLADYICTLELTALKYQAHADTTTDRMFFGQWGSFKKNYLRKLRKHRLG